jgi:drug/metabolite transporter (DMT)-like permease
MISAVLGFAGIIVTNLDGTGFAFGLGDFLLILASLCSCLGMVISKNATKRVSPVQLVAYSQFEGGIFLLICGWVMGGHFAITDMRGLLVFSYICIASIVAYVLWNTLVKYNNLSKLSVIKFTEPLFAVIFSGIILGEEIFKLSYIGAFVIIFCSVLIMYSGEGAKVE